MVFPRVRILCVLEVVHVEEALRELQCIAVCCSVFQCVADVLQVCCRCVAVNHGAYVYGMSDLNDTGHIYINNVTFE